jgi:hypothetical protein
MAVPPAMATMPAPAAAPIAAPDNSLCWELLIPEQAVSRITGVSAIARVFFIMILLNRCVDFI